MRTMRIGEKKVGDGQPCYIIAEIGINHDGSLEKAKTLMTLAASAGVDAVKLQKRNNWERLIPPDMWDEPKLAPWGETMPYHEYRKRMEFDKDGWTELFGLARTLNVDCFASVWDRLACSWLVDEFPDDLAAIKIPSAHFTNEPLVHYAATRALPVILSTGMSTMAEIQRVTEEMGDYGTRNWALLHCHSAYPAPTKELNLNVINAWRYFSALSNVPIGYSGHEVGLATTVAAVALGACIVERHITLDRASTGSDHAASIEPNGFARLVRDIRKVESALGDGKKVVWDTELPAKAKLRPNLMPSEKGQLTDK